jgi:hypothetical protein
MARIKNISKRTPITQFRVDSLEEAVGEKRILGFDSEGKPIDYGVIDIDPRLIGSRIITPGVLVINSETSATLTGAEWVFDGVNYSFTGALVLQNKPTSPNNRFDIITVNGSETPSVESGTAAEDAIVPSPSTPGNLVLQTIYRPHTEPDIVSPPPPAEDLVYQTATSAGSNTLYAPIWRQITQINRTYDFKISYVFWTSSYRDINNHHPQNGVLMVNFVTNPEDRLIDSDRVRIVQMDSEGQSGDFALVQTASNEVTLFARKTGFHGTHFYDYEGPKNATVLKDSLLQGQPYAALPAGTTYLSWNGRSYTYATGNVLNFDKPYVHGFDGTPLTGTLTISGVYVDDSVKVKVLHNDTVAPTVNVPVGSVLRTTGTYVTEEDNLLEFSTVKNSSGVVVLIEMVIR